MPVLTPKHAALLCSLIAALTTTPCLAGRPLSVDDANVNEPGAGHVEAWYTHESGASSWNIAPAYGLTEGVEIAAALARDSGNQSTATALQAKFRITKSQEQGCNFAATLGMAHASGDSGNSPYLNGIATCNGSDGAVHFNLGAVRPSGGATLRTWGLAYEREFGALTGHAEYFGTQQNRPTFQLGLRGNPAKNIQFDGTLGRNGNDSLYSLGTKFMF